MRHEFYPCLLIDLGRAGFQLLNQIPRRWGWYIYTAVRPLLFYVDEILIYTKEALITYATTLAFYLYLRASEYYSQRPELLRSHPIFARLLQLKQALTTLEELDFHLSESDSGIGDTEDEDSLVSEEGMDGPVLSKRYRKGAQLEFDDLAALLREAEEAVASVKTQKKTKPTTLTRPPKEPPKKKRKISTATKSSTVFDLEEPTYVSSKPRTSTLTLTSGEGDAFGDAMVLGSADAADKKARRHTLRFHTSKIESASARRQGARLSLGGDDDVPYRERRKEKEARAQREAQAGKRGLGGDDLDGIETESLVRRAGKVNVDEDDESAEDVDGYYSLVQRRKREEKESKKLAYEAAKATIRCVVKHCLAVHPIIASILLEHAHIGRLTEIMRKARDLSRVQS